MDYNLVCDVVIQSSRRVHDIYSYWMSISAILASPKLGGFTWSYRCSSGVVRVLKLGGAERTPKARVSWGGLGACSPKNIFISRVSKTLFLAFSGRFIDNLKAKIGSFCAR